MSTGWKADMSKGRTADMSTGRKNNRSKAKVWPKGQRFVGRLTGPKNDGNQAKRREG